MFTPLYKKEAPLKRGRRMWTWILTKGERIGFPNESQPQILQKILAFTFSGNPITIKTIHGFERGGNGVNKKPIAWVTDSTAFIPEEVKRKHEIYVVPLEIIFGQQVYQDGVDISSEQIYEKMKISEDLPKTSQPSVGTFLHLFEKLKEEYECAIAVHLSGNLSGTLNASRNGAEIAEFPVETVDSKLMSYPMTSLILQGMEMAKKGLDYRAIASALREMVNRFENYILIGSLEQFYKGGRMSGLQFFLGNLLQIKPILRLEDGVFEVFEKVRTYNKAIARILEQLDKAVNLHRVTHVQILHGNILDKALEVKEKIKKKYQHIDVLVGPISSAMAVHAGQGTLALTWLNE